MKWIAITVAVILAIIGMLAAMVFVVGPLVGRDLPRDHVAVARVRYAASPSQVWAVIDDPSTLPSWRPNVTRVDMLPPVNGKLAWREHRGAGGVEFIMDEVDAPRRMVTRITNVDDVPFTARWEYVLEPSGGGSVLTITEQGSIGPAMFRTQMHYVSGYAKAMVTYQRELGAKLGEKVQPEIVKDGR